MDNIKLLENNSIDFDETILTKEYTSTPSISEFTNDHKSAVLTCIVSGMLLTMPNEARAIEIPRFIASTDNPLVYWENYKRNIDDPISDFLYDVNCIASKKHTKKEIIKEILSFKTLNNNWDGYGAIPLEIESASNAILLIDLLGESIFCSVNEIYPNPNGTISLKWNNASDETLSMEVGNNTLSYYISLSNSKPLFFNNIEINAKEAEKISKYIQML